MSPSCHESCREVGMGKMGRGGGLAREEEERDMEDDRVRRMRKKVAVGVANLGLRVLGI